jgi:histone acetyltransferase (RNA polymerase elongator complex component)
MQARGVKCNCIRCREVKDNKIGAFKINVLEYSASGGQEYFISADSRDGQVLYGFCRLRLDNNSPIAPALIRELHVYGELVAIGGLKKTQHSGLGKKLLSAAEKIAKHHKVNRLAVISGVGVRGYYRKQGYKLQATYLVKNL